MSKAFTKETDDPQADRVDEPYVSPLPPGVSNYVTAEGARRFRAELERLQHERTALAAAPEPADADAAAQASHRHELDRRIRHLVRCLQGIEVVEPPLHPDRVVFGATVTLRDAHDRERRYRLVGVDEAEVRVGAISWLSPIAQALEGARVGDVVTLRRPGGSEELEVVAIA